MLVFSGVIVTKENAIQDFKIKAKSEAEAKTKLREKNKKRIKPLQIHRIDLEYVDFA